MEFKQNMILKVNLMKLIKNLNNKLIVKEKNQEEKIKSKIKLMIKQYLEILIAKS